MPLHLEDLDVVPELRGSTSALIVPCNMCPAVTVAANQQRPFMRFFSSPFRSAPFDEHVAGLQSRLHAAGVRADVFRSDLYHQWFLCMWTEGRRQKLQKQARAYDAVIVLGCETAHVTVRDAVTPVGCKVVDGMKVTGFMNAKLKLQLPCNVSFADCRIIPMSHETFSESVQS